MNATGRQQQILGAIRTALDYTLVVLYGGAALGTLTAVLRARAHADPGGGWAMLRLSYYIVSSYYWRAMLAGALLFAGGSLLKRSRAPGVLIGVVGGLVAAALGVLVVYSPAPPWMPMQFIFAFGYLPIPMPPLLGLLFGLIVLPRSVAATARDFSTRHFVALVPLLLAVF